MPTVQHAQYVVSMPLFHYWTYLYIPIDMKLALRNDTYRTEKVNWSSWSLGRGLSASLFLSIIFFCLPLWSERHMCMSFVIRAGNSCSDLSWEYNDSSTLHPDIISQTHTHKTISTGNKWHSHYRQHLIKVVAKTEIGINEKKDSHKKIKTKTWNYMFKTAHLVYANYWNQLVIMTHYGNL